MIGNLNVTFRHVDVSPALEQLVRDEVDRLDRSFNAIVSAHVTIDRAHERGGAPFDVRIALEIPGRNVVVTHHADAREYGPPGDEDFVRLRKSVEIDESEKDPAIAIRAAFRKARRQLDEFYQERWK